MTHNIYALLVGINKYPVQIPQLQGCVNDIEAIDTFLKERLSKETISKGISKHIKILINEEATYQAVIDNFKNHLGQASEKDTVLFYYAGHGSQEPAPEEFWDIEPDRLNETLVCYDSRTANGKDLADKELAYLIGKVAEKNPHIIVILDCCHSGSGTRDPMLQTEERRIPKSNRQRPLNSYVFAASEINDLAPATRSPNDNPSGWNFSRGRHVVFSACRDFETAKELLTQDGKKHGAFSYYLLDALSQTNGSFSYRDLFQRTNALIRSNVAAQSPLMESTVSEDLELPFLGSGTVAERQPYFTVSYCKDLASWTMNGGAIHGISAPVSEESTRLALFPFIPADGQAEALSQLSNAIGEVEVTLVLPQLSKLKFTKEPESLTQQAIYKAVIVSQPLPPMEVSLEGDDEGIHLVRQAIQVAGENQQRSLYVAEGQIETAVKFRLLAKQGEYIITRPADDRPLVTQIKGYTPSSATEVVKTLEHIARWLKVVDLNSPSSSRISSGSVKLLIYDANTQQELTESQIRLEYRYDTKQAKWEQPTFRVQLKNTSTEPLFYALFDLTERFAVQSILEGGAVRLEPQQEAWVLAGKPLYGIVPKQLWEQGVTEYKDTFKLIACTTDFDPTLLEQGNLGQPLPPASRSANCGGGTLNRLMKRVITREISAKPEEDEIYDDWLAKEITFTFVRPQNAPPIDRNVNVPLGNNVVLQAHEGLTANVRLTTVSQSTRDLGNHIVPPILQRDNTFSQPFQFTSSRGTDPGLSALELSKIDAETIATVTTENPLRLIIGGETLLNEENLLAIAYDGEFFLPVGLGQNKNNNIEIALERLPNPVFEGERSLQGSIRIFFQKIISKRLKLDFPYPLLSAVDVKTDETVDYDPTEYAVKERVAKAKRIVLFIHGIIGDTESMVPSVQRAKVQVNGQERPLFDPDVYDLVLAFDYENLNTSIVDNARSLKQRLESVGLGKGHGKTLHIVAHSMGGLVSRWFIEREGGKGVVQHLIMLGTPNNGSPWPNVVDFALPLLAIGLNGLAVAAWPVSAIGALMSLAGSAVGGADRNMTTALKEMQEESTLVNTLFASEPPCIPYNVIAGNTSIIQPKGAESQEKIKALLNRLGKFVIESPFMGLPNDIAVKVNSITHLPPRTPEPQITEVACDHLTYFSDPAGLTALAEAVHQALQLGSDSPTAESSRDTATSNFLSTSQSESTPSQLESNRQNSDPPIVKKTRWSGVLIGGVCLVLVAIATFLFWQKQQNPQPSNPSKSNQSLNSGSPKERIFL